MPEAARQSLPWDNIAYITFTYPTFSKVQLVVHLDECLLVGGQTGRQTGKQKGLCTKNNWFIMLSKHLI